jgi:hypothetical protein
MSPFVDRSLRVSIRECQEREHVAFIWRMMTPRYKISTIGLYPHVKGDPDPDRLDSYWYAVVNDISWAGCGLESASSPTGMSIRRSSLSGFILQRRLPNTPDGTNHNTEIGLPI